MANALKRARWSDKWVLFDGYGVYIVMNVSSIDVRNNKLSLMINVSHDEYNDDYDTKINHSNNYTIITLSMSDEHYNVNTMINGIKGSITRLITENYRSFAASTDEYKEAQRLDNYIYEQAGEDAAERLDDLDISDDDIREAYIEGQKADAYTVENRSMVRDEYRNSHRDSLIALVVSSLQFAER